MFFGIYVFDIIILLILGLFIIEEARLGIISSFLNLISVIAGFFVGYLAYDGISKILHDYLDFTPGFSDAAAFIILISFLGLLIRLLLYFLETSFVFVRIPKKIDVFGGALFGFISFFLVVIFFMALLHSFPVSQTIKEGITKSYSGSFLMANTGYIDGVVNKVFGKAIEDTVDFMTIKPTSNELVPLYFRAESMTSDPASEKLMLIEVNNERQKQGKSSLGWDEQLAEVARSHAQDMIKRRYFSHYSPEGRAAIDRLEKAGVTFTVAGENLALAPDVSYAMRGLMKSPGHRENILSSEFGKLGIGVVDIGLYGKVFVQQFSD